MIIERDVPVALRDGVRIYVDVYRPLDEEPAAPLIAWGPYGKHMPNELRQRFPTAGLKPDTCRRSPRSRRPIRCTGCRAATP